MTAIGVLQIVIFFGLILACAKPLGTYMARVFEGQRTFMHPLLRWLEVLTYKLVGVKEDVEQRWTQYTAALLSFSVFGFLLTYLLQRAQGLLPFNPQHFNAGNVPPDLAFNTAISFVTNTNWQAYSVNPRPVIWCRWPAWRCRTSPRPPSGCRSRSRWCAGSPAS